MDVRIIEAAITRLAVHARVSMAFAVDRVLDISE
jgi:hypothetical protein